MWFDTIMWVMVLACVATIYFQSRSIDFMIKTQDNHNATIDLIVKEQARIRDVVALHLGKDALDELYDGKEPK